MPHYTSTVNAKVRNVRHSELSVCTSLRATVFCCVQQLINIIIMMLQ